MANDLSNPVNATVPASNASGDGFFDHGAGTDSLFSTVQLAQAEGAAAPVPGQTIQVAPPQGASGPVVIRVPVAPGSTVELPQPFDADATLLAKEGDGNLAIRVGDVTVILQGYIDANNDPQQPVTIEGADGQPIDIATILASTDPTIEIETAAGADAGQGGQGADNTGAILAQLDGANGLGGFEGAGAQDQTELGYSTIDSSIQQDFADTLLTSDTFGFTVGTISGSFGEGFLRDPAQTTWLGDFANFMTEYQDAVENPSNPMFPGWADFYGTSATTGDFAEYLSQTRQSITVDANFTGATGALVLNGIAPGITSNGSTLYVQHADQGATLFVRRDEDDALVAVIHVEGPDASGHFTIDTFMINRIDHPEGEAGDDAMQIEVEFTVYDGPAPNPEQQEEGGPTSPSIEGSFTATFNDDVPILESIKYHNQHEINPRREAEGVDSVGADVGLIDEDWLKGGAKDKGEDGTGNSGENGDTGGGTCVTGCIQVNFGADGKAQTDSKSEDAGKHAFELNTGLKLGDDYGTLHSGGVQLVVLSISGDHITVGIADAKQPVSSLVESDETGDETPTAPTDPIAGCTIFTLTLDQDTGEFKFELKGPLDHVSSDTIFGDETGVSALVVAPSEETIPLEFGVKAYDDDGDSVQAAINIDVNDDVPVARDDSDTIAAGTYGPLCGNVMTGWHTDSPSTGKDSQGGDHASVTSVVAGDKSFAAGTEVQGEHGKLTLNADGSYSYTRDAYSKGGVDDVFTYTLTDGDGDTDTATLTIHIADSGVCIELPKTGEVDEAGLPARGSEPAGSDTASDSEQTSGTVTITAKDGIQSLDIAGHELSLGELKDLVTTPFKITDSTGELTLTGFDEGTGALSYTYVLKDNTAGEGQSVSFDITVKDVDDDEKTATLTINIVDDEPTANCDTITLNAPKEPTADVQFILDISGSMEDRDVNVSGYPDNGIGLERYAVEQMLDAHPEIQNVQFVLFDEHADHSDWMTRDQALAWLKDGDNFKNGGGNTNFDAALDEAMDGLVDSRPLPNGDQTLVYFFSDGNPNQPASDPGITDKDNGSQVSKDEWQDFVDAHGVSNVFAVGIGTLDPNEISELNPIAYPEASDGTEQNLLAITNTTNLGGLLQTLNDTIVSAVTAIPGNVLDNDVSGADDYGDGKLVQVTYDGDTFAFDSSTHQHIIDLGAGRGSLLINDDGTYEYTPPAKNADGTPFYVEYTIQDGDGDQSTAKLKIDINTRPETDLNGGGQGADNTAHFVEDNGAVQISPNGTVSDDGPIHSMTVTLANRPDGDATEMLSLNAAAQQAVSNNSLNVAYNNGVLTISGPEAPASVYQTILQGILYNNGSQAPNESDRHITVVVNDGAFNSVSHEIEVCVTSVNDAPDANIIQDPYSATEDQALTLSGPGRMTISDVDAGNEDVTVTLSVTEGIIDVTKGNSGVQVSNDETSSVTLTGTVAEINALLAGTGAGGSGKIVYLNTNDSPQSAVTLKLTVNDQGETGIGGAKSDFDTATINVANVNDKPVTDLNGGSSGSDNWVDFQEDFGAVKIAASGTVKDDGLINSMTVKLTNHPDNAAETLSLNATAQQAADNAGLTVTAYNAATGVLVISGPSAAASVYQTILQGIVYNNTSNTPNLDDRQVTVAVTDAGGLVSTTHTVTIDVDPTNDAPTATAPATGPSVDEQTDLVISGKGFSINDVDAGSDTMTVTLSVVEGKLTVTSGNSGIDSVSNNGTGSVTITGSQSEINSLLTGSGTGKIVYRDDTDTPADTTKLTLTVNDQNNNGEGGAKSASVFTIIDLNDTNDKPVTDLNGGGSGANNAASFTEDLPAVLIAPSATVSDDSGKLSSMTVSLSSRPDGAAETLSLNAAAELARTTNLLSITNVNGVITISGAAPVDAAVFQTILRGIVYNNSSQAPDDADRTVTVTVKDGGNLVSDSHSITVAVNPVNDAPVATITPASFNAVEETGFLLSGKGLSISDVDAGSGAVTVTLSVGEGMLNVSKGNSGVDSLSGSGTSKVTITGTISEINSLLGGGSTGAVEYLNTADTPSAQTTLTLKVDDNGYTGSGPDLTATDTAIIYIQNTTEAPIACDDNVVTNAGANLFSIPDWALVYNDTDVDTANSGLSVSGVSNSSGGTATDGAGSVTFSDPSANGGEFDYQVSDGTNKGTGHVDITQDTSGTLSGSSSDDIVVVYGSTGATVDAGDGNDIVLGGGGKDTLNGGSGNDLIFGGAGNDTIDGGSGNDLIFGEAGNDTMVYGSGDKYDGGDNFDRVQLTGSGTTVTYDAAKFLNVEMIDIGDSNDRSGSSNQNTLALNAADLGVHNYGTIAGKEISLFVIGDHNGSNANNRDNVDLTGFSNSGLSGSFTDAATGAAHNFNVWTSNANSAIHVAVEQNLDVV